MKIYASFVVKEAFSRRLVCELTKDMYNPPGEHMQILSQGRGGGESGVRRVVGNHCGGNDQGAVTNLAQKVKTDAKPIVNVGSNEDCICMCVCVCVCFRDK